MASISAVTFNSGSTIDGTIQVGQLAIGSTPQDYANGPGGLRWWSSADLESGYIIAHVNTNANQPNSQGISGVKVGFWRTQFTDSDFISWAEYIAKRYHTPETFSTATEANIWLFANGYWTSYSNEPIPTTTLTPTLTTTPTPTPTPSSTPGDDALFDPIITENDEYIDLGNDEYLMFVDPSGPVVTPSSTPEVTTTPTPSVTETPTNTPTPSSSVTATPSVTPTITPTSSEISATPTQTPTPSTTPIPVTGYGYNLIALPYNFPTSGNSIMNATAPQQTGTTLINELSITQRGFYFNSIDNTGVDRTSYYSQFTGQSVTITFTQNGDSAIYSGDSASFKFWSGDTGTPPGVPGTGFVFGTEINIPPTTGGTAVLIQSASTTWVTGVTVYVSVQNSEPEVTPTSTATSVTPTPTPTSGAITSGFTVTIQQIGPDVVWSGSGSFDISNLSLEGTQQLSAGFSANSAVWAVGPNIQVNVESYGGVAFDTYPTSFGTGGSPATNGTGDLFGILPGGSGRSLVVPENYISGTQLSGSTTYANTTISGLNLVVGTYTYSWGSNPGETLTLIIE